MLNDNKRKYGTRILSNDTFSEGPNKSYFIEYEINSSTADGAKTKGTFQIKKLEGKSGIYSYSFVLMKGVDF